MRRALIVHAHPERNSFVSGMMKTAALELTEMGYSVEVSDLYADNFDPVAKAADFSCRIDPGYLKYAREQRNAFKSGTLAPDVEREFDRLMAADLVVFTFPLYWFSVPAILKGWFDRVFLPGPVYSGRRIYDCGGLAGKRALVGCALGGRQHMFGQGAVHGQIEVMLRHLLQGTIGYTGMAPLSPYFAYHVPYLEEDDREALMTGWRTHVRSVDDLTPLAIPKLAEFDELMRPVNPGDKKVT